MKSVIVATVASLCVNAGLVAQMSESEGELRRLHATLISAHLENDPELWASMEAADYVSANAGSISFPSTEERLAGRTDYLRSASFTEYRDVREPLVRVSEDGTLGWLIAEVRVTGHLRGPDGTTQPFDDVWAWIELYERGSDGWKLVGNVSNSREP